MSLTCLLSNSRRVPGFAGDCLPTRSGLDQWSGQPNTVRLDELDVICAVLGCGVAELLLPEPETVPQPQPAGGEQAPAVAEARPVAPRPRGGRSLPPR